MKKVYHLLLLLLAGISFVSCKQRDGDPAPEGDIFMTIVLRDRFMENSTDRWVLATNENGELLDVAQFHARDKSIELRTTKSFSRIDFTILTFTDKATDILLLETFNDFPINEAIEFGPPPDKVIPHSGVANIKVTNYNESIAANLNLNFATAAFGTNSILTPSLSGSSFSVFVNLGNANETVHVYGLRSGVPVYKMLTNVVPNETRSSDFSTFSPFENFIPLPYEGFAYTAGIMEDKTTLMLVQSSNQGIPSKRQIYLATVPGFVKYETMIHDASGFEYWKIGSSVSSFAPPSYTTAVQNNSIKNFETTISGTHDYKYAEFRTTAPAIETTWAVYASGTSPASIKFEIPGEVTSAYPSLRLDDLKYKSGIFYRSSGTYTYNDMLNSRFKKVQKSELELYTLPTK